MCTTQTANNGAACDDGLFCTVNDTCQGGLCSGAAKVCPASDACHVATCEEALNACTEAAGNNGAACDDGLFCTVNDTCQGGLCAGVAKVCAASDACHVATCNEALDVCVQTPGNDGAACGTLMPCTAASTCVGGLCQGNGPIVYFSEDFHDNSKGWTFDNEWQIGPAMASAGQTFGFPDPANDHTVTNDNGIVGTVIGGNVAQVVHDYLYVTSPTFNGIIGGGPVVLNYYRWLNLDVSMSWRIEVWDGVSWKLATQVGSAMQQAWQGTYLDLSQWKNAAMRIRFGFDVKLGNVQKVSGLNFDDLVVTSVTCF